MSNRSAEGISEAACVLDFIASGNFAYYNLLKGISEGRLWANTGDVSRSFLEIMVTLGRFPCRLPCA